MARKKSSRKPAAGEQEAATAPLIPLSAVIGNVRPRLLLARALGEGRLSPGLLLHGPAGIGKFTAARALAAVLNCTAPDGADACGACASCRKVNAWSHPDIKVLESEADAQQAGRPLFFPDPQASSRSLWPRPTVATQRRPRGESNLGAMAAERRTRFKSSSISLWRYRC